MRRAERRPGVRAQWVLATVLGLLAAASTAEAGCVKPDPARLMRERNDAMPRLAASQMQVFPVVGDARKARWVTLSWAPAGGAAFVVDCAGKVLAWKALGAFDRVRPGPTLAGRHTLETLYQPESWPDKRMQSVALLVFSAPRIEVLWRHESLDESTPPLTPRDEAAVWRWRYEPDGRTIRVTGHRTSGQILDLNTGRAKGLTRHFRPEKFCWIPGRRLVDRC